MIHVARVWHELQLHDGYHGGAKYTSCMNYSLNSKRVIFFSKITRKENENLQDRKYFLLTIHQTLRIIIFCKDFIF